MNNLSILCKTGLIALMAAVTILTSLLSAPARAEVMLMPVRAVFTDRDRTKDVTIINTSPDDAVFELTWLYQRQDPDGSYTEMEGPIDPAHDPAKMLAFSPRRVSLPGNGRQRVRISLRRPPDLPPGEYRVHLKMKRLSLGPGGATALTGQGPAKPGGIQLGVGVNIGFAIPVIIRQGRYNADATIGEPEFVPPAAANAPARLKVPLSRTGTHGTMGRLQVYWTPPGGEEKRVGSLNNVNIFTELPGRTAMIPLNEKSIAGGNLRIVYDGDGPDRGIKFDEKIVPIGG